MTRHLNLIVILSCLGSLASPAHPGVLSHALSSSSWTHSNDDVAKAFAGDEDGAKKHLDERLAALGSAAAGPLFDVLITGRVPLVNGTDRPLTQDEEMAVVGALKRLSSAVLRRHLATLATSDADERIRSIGLDLLRGFAEGRDLDLMVSIAHIQDLEILPLRLRATFQGCLKAALKRGNWRGGDVGAAFVAAHASLHAPIVKVLEAQAGHRAVEAIAECLGVNPSADPLLLVALANQGAALPHPSPEGACRAARDYLRSGDVRMLLAALEAVEKLDDVDAVPALIELLDHPLGNVRKEALNAVHKLSVHSLGPDRQRWETWHQGELRWWRREGSKALREISTAAPAVAADQLMTLTRHRLYRHDLASGYAEVLKRDEKELILLACSALGTLGSWNGVPGLVEALGHEDFTVRTAAAKALKQITGQEFAHDQRLWDTWVRRQLAAD